jgi:SAM-dependent methyltransferase
LHLLSGSHAAKRKDLLVKPTLTTGAGRVASLYNSMSDTYDNIEGEPFYDNQYRAYRRSLDRYLSLFAGDVLDLGCGTGIFSAMLAPRCRRVVGVDIAVGLIEKARLKCRDFTNTEFYEASATSLPFGCGEFDAVVSFGEPLSHIEEYATAFAEAGRVLRPGGVFLFSVLNKWCLRLVYSPSELLHAVGNAGGYWRVWRCEDDAGHATALGLRAFTSVEVRAAVGANSFDLVDRFGIHILSLAIPLRWQKSGKGPLAGAFRLLGRVDAVMATVPGLRNLGYTCIYAAQKR